MGDEAASLAAQEALLADDFPFLLGYDPAEPWARFVQRRDNQRRGLDLAPGWVPSTFLVAVTGPDIVGRISVRHELNRFLATVGGHIGYGVLPAFRRRGYATEMLRQGLIVARSVGVEDVLVTCDEDNIASAGVIERCDGVFESMVDPGDGSPRKRRYWIR
jgi:predicted acetyltransferase